MGLENLAPGAYIAVCVVDVPDGIPHGMRGIIAAFTVELRLEAQRNPPM